MSIQPTTSATNFSVINQTGGKYTVLIRDIYKYSKELFDKELFNSQKFSYTGQKNRFKIKIRSLENLELLGFLSVILPKDTTKNLTFTIKYEDPNFEVHFPDSQIIPLTAKNSITLNLSKNSSKLSISKRSKASSSKPQELAALSSPITSTSPDELLEINNNVAHSYILGVKNQEYLDTNNITGENIILHETHMASSYLELKISQTKHIFNGCHIYKVLIPSNLQKAILKKIQLSDNTSSEQTSFIIDLLQPSGDHSTINFNLSTIPFSEENRDIIIRLKKTRDPKSSLYQRAI